MESRIKGRLLAGTLALLLGAAFCGIAFGQAAATAPAAGAYLEKRHDDAKVACEACHAKDRKSAPVPLERCVKCHGDGDPKALAVKTAAVKPVNPHENRHYGVEADCGLCHRIHEPSVNFCADCHPRFGFKPK